MPQVELLESAAMRHLGREISRSSQLLPHFLTADTCLQREELQFGDQADPS